MSSHCSLTALEDSQFLCKYFLSVVDEQELPKFQQTVKWINGKIKSKNLPLISESITYDRASLQPRMTVYIRKRKSKYYPFAVCEFQFTIKRFVFIIPFCNEDENDFTNEVDFKRFWSAFKHYKKSGQWLQSDFSSNKAKAFEINLNATLK